MKCEFVQSNMSKYIEEDLMPDEASAMDAHIKTCAGCRQYCANMRQLVDTIHGLESESVPVDLTKLVLKRLNEKEKHTFILPEWLKNWRFYTIAAACALFVFVISGNLEEGFVPQKDFFYQWETPVSYEKKEEPVSEEMMLHDEAVAVGEVPASSTPEQTNQPIAPGLGLQNNTGQTSQKRQVAGNPAAPAAPIASMAPKQNTSSSQGRTPQVQGSASRGGSGAISTESSPNISFFFPNVSTEKKGLTAGTTAASETKTATNETFSNTATAKNHATVASLPKRKITFVVSDPEAAAVFQNACAGGADAVREAFRSADVAWRERESVVEEYAGQYNALAAEANQIEKQIAAGGATDSLRAALSEKEQAMKSLKDSCSTVSVGLSIS